MSGNLPKRILDVLSTDIASFSVAQMRFVQPQTRELFVLRI